jgi:predicted N-acetyltransferase YhbS
MTDLTLAIAPERAEDAAAIERLSERAFGPGRFARSAYRLREGAPHDLSLSFVARVGTLVVGSNRMTQVACGQGQALLLGPLTVEPAFHSRGIGRSLIEASLQAARQAGHGLVLLVGDEPFYGRFGFRRVPPGRLTFPGPVDPARLLACELQPSALEGLSGAVMCLRE